MDLLRTKSVPDLPRSFKVPAAPLVATLAVLLCLYLMLNLTGDTWVRFGIWMALGGGAGLRRALTVPQESIGSPTGRASPNWPSSTSPTTTRHPPDGMSQARKSEV